MNQQVNNYDAASVKAAAQQAAELAKSSYEKDVADGSIFFRYKLPAGESRYQWTLRFLPSRNEEGVPNIPFTSFKRSFFRVGAGDAFYAERSLASIGQADPLEQLCEQMRATGSATYKELVKQRAPRTMYLANVLVKSADGVSQEVKVIEFKQQIMEIIQAKLHPMYQGQQPGNPFCPYEGYTFYLRIHKQSNGIPTYLDSEFGPSTPLAADDKAIGDILSKTHDIQALARDPQYYKSYAELEDKLHEVGAYPPEFVPERFKTQFVDATQQVAQQQADQSEQQQASQDAMRDAG